MEGSVCDAQIALIQIRAELRAFVYTQALNERITMSEVPMRFKGDNQIVMEVFRYDPDALEAASDSQRDAKELVLIAMNRDGDQLRWVSDRLARDHDVVLAAVRNYGMALEYVVADLLWDKKICLAAVASAGLVTLWWMPPKMALWAHPNAQAARRAVALKKWKRVKVNVRRLAHSVHGTGKDAEVQGLVDKWCNDHGFLHLAAGKSKPHLQHYKRAPALAEKEPVAYSQSRKQARVV